VIREDTDSHVHAKLGENHKGKLAKMMCGKKDKHKNMSIQYSRNH